MSQKNTLCKKDLPRQAFQCSDIFLTHWVSTFWCCSLSSCINSAWQVFSPWGKSSLLRDGGLDQKLGSDSEKGVQFVECPLDGARRANIRRRPVTGVFSLVLLIYFISLFRPAVRALPSRQMFEHMLKRHDVLFVYVGGESPLKVSTVLYYITQRWIRISFWALSFFKTPQALNYILCEWQTHCSAFFYNVP